MKVSLINYTIDAVELLIFTKQTRLNMTAGRYKEIQNMNYNKKREELEYMANTIPSSWEFVDYTFSIEGVSRAFTHQFVRNRHGSYAQQSMRVTNVEGFGYVTGPSIINKELESLYDEAMDKIDEYYQVLINHGAEVEDARGVLPTNIETNIVAKFNLRTLSEIVKSRSGGRTQAEYREVVKGMADEVLKVHPWAEMFLFPKGRGYFDELEEAVEKVEDPHCRQFIRKAIDKMRKQ